MSFYFFMSQYLQGVTGGTPLQAGLAFLPATIVAFAAATATSRLMRRTSNALMSTAGVAGGLVNVAHHTGGALGLGILVTIFAAAGSGAHGPQQLLADRVSASLTGAAVFVGLALVVTLVARPRGRHASWAHDQLEPRAAL